MKHVSTSTTTTSVGPDYPHNLPRDPFDYTSIEGRSIADLEQYLQVDDNENRQLGNYVHALAAVDNERRFRAFYVDEAHLVGGPRPYQRDAMRWIAGSTARMRASLDLFAWGTARSLSAMTNMARIWQMHSLRTGMTSAVAPWAAYSGPAVDAHRGHVSALHFARTLVDTGKFSRPEPFVIYDEIVEYELAQHPDVVAAAAPVPFNTDLRRSRAHLDLSTHYRKG